MIFNLVQFAISSHGTAPPTQLINENRTGKKKKVSREDFSHSTSGKKHTKSTSHPPAAAFAKTAFFLKGSQTFTRKKPPSMLFTHEECNQQ